MLGINADPVTIKQVEVEIIDRAWDEGWVTPQPAPRQSGKTVAVIGSGPAGLAAAQQLTRAGHTVAVFERADRIGGLLRYGIPEFKMEKHHLDRRLAQMQAEGVKFRAGVDVGIDVTGADLRRRYDAVVVATGATRGATCRSPGRELAGIHQAMEYLPRANRVQEGDLEVAPIDAAGKHVVIIGGGDTGADCLGTAHRQGAASVTQLEILPHPPDDAPRRAAVADVPDDLPGPRARTRRAASGSTRSPPSASSTTAPAACGRSRSSRSSSATAASSRSPARERELPADLVLLAMGFTGPERGPLLDQLGVELDARGNVRRDASFMTSVDGVFVAGDAGRGQSLIVWAIAEGRSAASGVDRWLSGSTTLPAPIPPTARPLVV